MMKMPIIFNELKFRSNIHFGFDFFWTDLTVTRIECSRHIFDFVMNGNMAIADDAGKVCTLFLECSLN